MIIVKFSRLRRIIYRYTITIRLPSELGHIVKHISGKYSLPTSRRMIVDLGRAKYEVMPCMS